MAKPSNAHDPHGQKTMVRVFVSSELESAWLRVILAVASFALASCNANQAINPSGQAGRCANDTDCNPYNPASYAQNNTGIGR